MSVINALGSAMGRLLMTMFNTVVYPFMCVLHELLPKSPFQSYIQSLKSGEWEAFLMAINYFVPIGAFIGALELWVAAMFIWYLWRWIANTDFSFIFNEEFRKSVKGFFKSIVKILAK